MNCNAIYAFREDAQDGPMAAGKSSNMFGEISLGRNAKCVNIAAHDLDERRRLGRCKSPTY